MTGGLRRSTSELAHLFAIRMSTLRNRSDLIDQLRQLRDVGTSEIDIMALSEPRVAVGIDGSMDYDEVLEMLLFYVAAGGYQCTFTVQDGQPKFDLLNAKRTHELAASAAVPLWEEDLFSLVTSSEQIENDVDFRRTMERVPFALMTMAELYLAWRIAAHSDVRILFLDRPFSGTYPSLYRDTSFMLMREKLALDGFPTREGPIERLDLRIAHVIGSGVSYVPPRGMYLPYALLQYLMHNPAATRKEASEVLGISGATFEAAIRRLRNLDAKHGKQMILRDNDELIQVSERPSQSWPRVKALAISIAQRIFDPNENWKHPLLMDNGAWLSVTELNALNLFLLEALIEEAAKRAIMVIGVAKDTTATDFTRAALPTALALKNRDAKLPGIKSDKALLTILSTANSQSLETPWRTFAYDGCMATIIATPKEKEKLRAARRMITREQLFVRCYFQLRSFRDDPDIRAPVFLYDRIFARGPDDKLVKTFDAVERRRRTELRLFMEREGQRSKVDDIVLSLLAACDNPEVLEAYGHNQLLYLADKLVKGQVEMMKGLLRGVVDLELTPLARKEKVFSIARRFRDLRAESESARHRAAQTQSEVLA